ncbi:hypothetical protein VTK56DRAFT_894 [Thermocarpiscus australiensis]
MRFMTGPPTILPVPKATVMMHDAARRMRLEVLCGAAKCPNTHYAGSDDKRLGLVNWYSGKHGANNLGGVQKRGGVVTTHRKGARERKRLSASGCGENAVLESRRTASIEAPSENPRPTWHGGEIEQSISENRCDWVEGQVSQAATGSATLISLHQPWCQLPICQLAMRLREEFIWALPWRAQYLA